MSVTNEALMRGDVALSLLKEFHAHLGSELGNTTDEEQAAKEFEFAERLDKFLAATQGAEG